MYTIVTIKKLDFKMPTQHYWKKNINSKKLLTEIFYRKYTARHNECFFLNGQRL
jgi:hypothetical protein